MKDNSKRELYFLTGLPRSGTTWLADILGTHESFNYLSGEIFNPGTSKNTFGLNNLPWYIHSSKMTEQLEEQIPKALSINFSLSFFLQRVSILIRERNFNPKNYGKIIKHTYYSLNKKAIFTKDPTGFLLVPYLNQKLNAKIVIIKRNPYRFIASMKRMNWFFDFNCLPELYSKKFEDEIAAYRNSGKEDIVHNSIILWQIFECFLLDLKKDCISFYEINHETIMENPHKEVSQILAFFGEKMDSSVRKKIAFYQNQKGEKKNKKEETHNMLRTKAAVMKSWKEQLSEEDLILIREKTGHEPIEL
ncbi:sulfotransferase family protein [Salinimicrobium sediminilitoris]|uniref:sulfotransferase family protein n=1 Tax=Salinimicrobium sediminilitoris TaxID=2876715 RepID=UPI001E4425B1|nr:sulfotransferase [Salinimicrobium sediminilitoris]MCC8358454.1 sulfotransferase [Salinimicrobium sediminilitoris]